MLTPMTRQAWFRRAPQLFEAMAVDEIEVG